MSKRTKTKWEILHSPYLFPVEVGRLLGLSDMEAADTFRKAQQKDITDCGGIDKLVTTSKVSIESVLAVTHKKFDFLEKQLKNAEMP